jgi:hypothetical protein
MAGDRGLKRPASTPLQHPRNNRTSQQQRTPSSQIRQPDNEEEAHTTTAASPASARSAESDATSSVKTPANTQEWATSITLFLPASSGSSGLLLKHAKIDQLHKVLAIRELTALSILASIILLETYDWSLEAASDAHFSETTPPPTATSAASTSASAIPSTANSVTPTSLTVTSLTATPTTAIPATATPATATPATAHPTTATLATATLATATSTTVTDD